MSKKYFFVLLTLILTIGIVGMAAATTILTAKKTSGDDILGTWFVEEKDAKVEVYKCGNKYCGKIVWLQRPNDESGRPRTDAKNPESSKRQSPLIGTQVVKDFTFDASAREWSNGTVYDSRKGKVYSGYITLKDNNTLSMTGYILGMRWLSRTSTWTRAK